MKLPSLHSLLPIKKTVKPDKTSHFLALIIEKDSATAAVWEQGHEVIIKSIERNTNPLTAAQQALKLYPDITHAVFGIPSSSIQGNNNSAYLHELETLSTKIGLIPLGFVEIPEAIAHLLELESNTPQTAIFIGVSATTFSFSLFRIGKCAKSFEITRSTNLFNDIDRGLALFENAEILPSKILLYSSDANLADMKEQLLSYPWQQNEKFMHVPKIENLKADISLNAIVYAGFSEHKQQHTLTPVVHHDPVSEATATNTAKTDEEFQTDTTLHPQEDLVSHTTQPTFVTEEDSAEEFHSTVQSPPIVIDTTPASTNEEKMGFIIQKSAPAGTTQSAPSATIRKPVPQPVLSDSAKTVRPKIPFPRVSLPVVAFPHALMLSKPKSLAVIAGLLLFILSSATFSFAYFFPKVTVKLIAQPNIVSNDVTATLNSSLDSIDVESKQVPGKMYTVSLTANTTEQTSGKKIIGEKAKGEVTIYNKTSQPKLLAKGTVLSATSSLLFTLDQEVTVASASDTGESLAYGKQTASVVATKIGPAGNIKKDSELSVDNQAKSSVLAKNESDFSGGSEREIPVVSKDDQDKLVKKLTESLESEAESALREQVSDGEELLENSLENNIVEKKFDKEIGDETDNITLDLTVEFSQVGYKKAELESFFQEYMKSQLSDRYNFDAAKSYFNVTKTTQDSAGNVMFTAKYYAYLLPKIDIDNLPGQLAGKSVDHLNTIVNELADQNIIGYEIVAERQIPFISSLLPMNKQNIRTQIVSY